jgi:hypothetical protein
MALAALKGRVSTGASFTMNYYDNQIERAVNLIKNTLIFNGDRGNGVYRKKPRPFVLKDYKNNFYSKIVPDVFDYFSNNKISWWGGHNPTGHTLSSQVSCLNHLYFIRNDKDAVLDIVKNVYPSLKDIMQISTDEYNCGYIQFEAISSKDNLHEKQLSRGSNCTSVDALIYGINEQGKNTLFPIEWKYTEKYGNKDKSIEDGDRNLKGSELKGKERLSRYSSLINESKQLKTFPDYRESIYFYEPFYQLMRQTLWVEQIIKHKETELIKADEYMHIHVIPDDNKKLLGKYKVSNLDMEGTWRNCIKDQLKYKTISPKQLIEPLGNKKYKDLVKYLEERYW